MLRACCTWLLSVPTDKLPTESYSLRRTENGNRKTTNLPPAMTFKQHPPRQPYFVPPSSQSGAVLVIKSPNGETTKKNRKTKSNHEPHLVHYFPVSIIRCSLGFHGLRRRIFQACCSIFCPERRPQIHFHYIHTAK
jgi:hypothetical protein